MDWLLYLRGDGFDKRPGVSLSRLTENTYSSMGQQSDTIS